MKVSCKYCGKFHDVGIVCEKKPKRENYFRKGKSEKSDAFRRGTAWRNKSLAIRQRDRFCCRVCLELSDKYGTYSGLRVQARGLSVHHIVPVAEDYERRLDDDNLITLCSYHHERAEEGGIDRKELQALAENAIVFF